MPADTGLSHGTVARRLITPAIIFFRVHSLELKLDLWLSSLCISLFTLNCHGARPLLKLRARGLLVTFLVVSSGRVHSR